MEAENNTSGGKYIPPFRRKKNNTGAQGSAAQGAAPGDEQIQRGRPRRRGGNGYTHHAAVRADQRQISEQAIQKAMANGIKLESDEAITYTDEATQVVTSKDGKKIITVSENKRNTAFSLQDKTRQQEKMLLNKVRSGHNDYAMCELAELYLSGDLGDRDVKKAESLLLKAAKNGEGNSHAMCLLAQIYETGDLGAADFDLSLDWLKKAARKNNKYANAVVGQRLLGEYLEKKQTDPLGAAELLKDSMQYLQRSARKGSTRAMWQIAQIHEEGWAGQVDLAAAIKLYSDAARTGSPNSLDALWRLVNDKKFSAVEFESILEKASEHIARTSSELAADIGLKQVRGQLGMNKARGLWLIEQAALKNNENAMRVLAECYRDGVGAEPNPEKATAWFLRLKQFYETAMRKGNINATLNLGKLYLKGAFGQVDFANAERTFIAAGNRGSINALFYLGSLCIKGKLGGIRQAEGVVWINKAIEAWSKRAKQGDVDAAIFIAQVYLSKKLELQDYEKAAVWLFAAASQGSVQAFFDLVKLCYKEHIPSELNLATVDLLPNVGATPNQKVVSEELLKTLSLLNAAAWKEEDTAKRKEQLSINLESFLLVLGKTYPSATLLLAKLAIKGNLLAKNFSQATRWLHAVTSVQYSEEFFDKANKYFKHLLSNTAWQEEDKKQILQTLQDIAEHSQQRTPFRIGRILGDVYRKGQVTKPDFAKASFWYEKAASLENFMAAYGLGKLHQMQGTEKDSLEKAIGWYVVAAKQGNQKALKMLTQLYDDSRLTDETRAIIKPLLPEPEIPSSSVAPPSLMPGGVPSTCL